MAKDSVHVETGDILGFTKLNDSFPIPYVFNPQQSADLWYHSLDNKHRLPRMMDIVQFEEIGFPYHFSIAITFLADKKPNILQDISKDSSNPMDQNKVGSKSEPKHFEYKSTLMEYKKHLLPGNGINESDHNTLIKAETAMNSSVHVESSNSSKETTTTNVYSTNVSVNPMNGAKASVSSETSNKTLSEVRSVKHMDNRSGPNIAHNTGQEYKLSDSNMTDTSDKNESSIAMSSKIPSTNLASNKSVGKDSKQTLDKKNDA